MHHALLSSTILYFIYISAFASHCLSVSLHLKGEGIYPCLPIKPSPLYLFYLVRFDGFRAKSLPFTYLPWKSDPLVFMLSQHRDTVNVELSCTVGGQWVECSEIRGIVNIKHACLDATFPFWCVSQGVGISLIMHGNLFIHRSATRDTVCYSHKEWGLFLLSKTMYFFSSINFFPPHSRLDLIVVKAGAFSCVCLSC